MSHQLAGARVIARLAAPRANWLSFALVVGFAAVIGLAFAIATGF